MRVSTDYADCAEERHDREATNVIIPPFVFLNLCNRRNLRISQIDL
jgi:hypothetical protein